MPLTDYQKYQEKAKWQRCGWDVRGHIATLGTCDGYGASMEYPNQTIFFNLDPIIDGLIRPV